jgi:alkanesulfonate monooxygenase SsuD/methylene tetrahydromethanopterin reductase-like flavin-dependent oxidoreductase (luciferase family)
MRVGIMIHPTTAATPAESLDQLIDHVKLAESEGYTSAWICETHFDSDQPEVAPLVLGGALAAETEGIRLGVMVKLPLEHPVKTAEDASVIDLMSNGRLLFGADPGASGIEFSGYSVTEAEGWERFVEALDIVVRAWTSDGFAYLGKFHTLPKLTRASSVGGSPYVPEPYVAPYVDPWRRVDEPFDYMSVLPKPAQIPHPPVFIMAVDDDAAALAARKGYSPVYGADAEAKDVAARANGFWQELEAAGRDRSEVCLTVVRDISLADSGDVDGVLHGLKQLQQETECRQILCRFQLPGLTPEQVNQSLKLFAAQVRPRLEM